MAALGLSSASLSPAQQPLTGGHIVPGRATGTVTSPATAPTVATDATSGGSISNTPYYIRIKLVNMNGVTLYSPVQSFTPSTCGGGACTLSINVAGNEWREGAPAYRVYACTSSAGTTCYLQTGFAEELDTTGALANTHYTPGTIVLTSVSLSGSAEADSASNTAVIDADQVAYNRACGNWADNVCRGTLQYPQNPASSYAQTGTTPLVVSGVQSRIRGHGVPNVDTVTGGSTRNCTFTHIKLACVMVMNVNGVSIDGLNVNGSDIHGYMLNTWPSTFNRVSISNASVSIGGTTAVAPLTVKGIWYDLQFDNLQLTYTGTGTSSNRGACVLFKNPSGFNWRFTGPGRWTCRGNGDVFRNDKGHSDPEHATSATFPNNASIYVKGLSIQWGSHGGTGQGVILKGGNVNFEFDNVTHSDYSPAAGTGPLLEIGSDANGAGSSTYFYTILNSPYLNIHANNSDFMKVIGTTTVGPIVIRNSNTATGEIDLASTSVTAVDIETASSTSNYCNPALGYLTNAAATQTIRCMAPANDAVAAQRVGNFMYTGGLISKAPGAATYAHLWWEGSTNYGMAIGSDPNTASTRIWQATSTKQFNFYDNAGTATLFRIDARSGVDLIETGATIRPRSGVSTADVGATSQRFRNGFFDTGVNISVATGTAPMTIASTTKVSNLNVDQVDGADWAAPASIGSGTPAAGAFTTLGASSTVAFTGTAASLINATSPTLTITDSTTPVTLIATANDSTADIGTSTTHNLRFATNNGIRWELSGAAGHLLATNDNAIDIGASGATRPRTGYFGTSVIAPVFTAATSVTAPLYATTTNCASSGGTCSAAASGSVSIAAAATTVTVATTAVTANSVIIITEDSSLGTKLGVTCNTTIARNYAVTARTAATSFVITTDVGPITNPACLNYWIIN